jgi:hypothetical protein
MTVARQMPGPVLSRPLCQYIVKQDLWVGKAQRPGETRSSRFPSPAEVGYPAGCRAGKMTLFPIAD